MSAESDLYDALTGDAGVSALVATRVYPLVAPQEAIYPKIAYQAISRQRVTAHDGEDALERVLFQITIVAATFSSAIAVRDAVKSALNAQTQGSVQVFLLDNEDHQYGDETNIYAIRQDYIAWHAG